MKKLFLVFLLSIVLAFLVLASAQSQQANTKQTEPELESQMIINQYGIKDMVKEIETIHCKISDAQLKELKMSSKNILKVREFCKKSTDEKTRELVERFKSANETRKLQSQIIGYDNSYSCIWSGINTGIPTQSDLGLTATSCSWHDASPQICRVQGSVGCLWGCTNTDPFLGWHTRYFASKTALENAILPLGYTYSSFPIYSGYRRTLPYGYSYELAAQSVDSSGRGTYHIEGPEPDPRFNWPGFIGGWYPTEVFYWHQIFNC